MDTFQNGGGAYLQLMLEVHFNHVMNMYHHQQKPQEVHIDLGFL